MRENIRSQAESATRILRIAAWAPKNKGPQTRWLNSHHSEVRKSKIKEGISRAGFFSGLSLCLVDGHFLSVFSHGLPCVPGSVLISFYKDSSHID